MPPAPNIRLRTLAQAFGVGVVPQLREQGAFTLPKLRGRFTSRSCRAVSLAAPNSIGGGSRRSTTEAEVFNEGGFTLLEMLVVMAMLLFLLAAIMPAVSSLSKSNGRKAALEHLIGGIEQARAQAIAHGEATYVVFPTFGNGTSPTILERYNFRSYAIFEDDPLNPGIVKQLTSWRTLPTGISLRSGLPRTSPPKYLDALATSVTFAFTPLNSTANFPFLKFNTLGELDTPAADIVLGLFEGFVSNGAEKFTCANDQNGNPLASEYLMVAQHTGRAMPTTPTPTPTP
jgi:prepilin-type N-terminal cleavage/methylation domain-containing protein